METSNLNEMIALAVEGDGQALEKVLSEVQDLVFNLSIRMLGTVADAEDATQDILVRIMTNLSSFRKDSKFSTWVYRIAVNYLIDYKKSMFAQHPLDFDFYANDIKAGYLDQTEELLMGQSKEVFAEELKISCTNVMLQCFDPQTRCIFILGSMFKIDSKVAGEILGISSDNYRQKLSRARNKMADFLSAYCGLTNTGSCNCKKRLGYAVKQRRLDPRKLEYKNLKLLDSGVLEDCKENMETIDELSLVFHTLPNYKSTLFVKDFVKKLLQSNQMEKIKNY